MSEVLAERALHTSGIVVVGSNYAEAPTYVDYLTTNYIGVLSYDNIIVIMGAFYVFILLLKVLGVFKGLRKIHQLLKKD